MKKNILIIEDNPVCREALVKITRECDDTSVIFCAADSEKAYKTAIETRIDLFLVDIVLDKAPGDVSGILFADRIREIKRYQFVPIIFITALESYRMNVYDNIHCYRYIEKPFDIKQVKDTILAALEFPCLDENCNRFFYYKKDKIIYSVDTDDLIYAVYEKRAMWLYMTQETAKVSYMTCNDLLKQLNNANFIRCNRNTIINRRYIDFMDSVNRYVHMRNGKTLEIGSVLKKSFFRELGYDC